jgi:ribosomal protein L29
MKNTKELLAISLWDLHLLLESERRKYIETRLSMKSKKEWNTSLVKKLKKYVAQILTVINKKVQNES